MADLVLIVARTELKQHLYLKHSWADERREVLLDRRTGRRRMERRRHRDIAQELQSQAGPWSDWWLDNEEQA